MHAHAASVCTSMHAQHCAHARPSSHIRTPVHALHAHARPLHAEKPVPGARYFSTDYASVARTRDKIQVPALGTTMDMAGIVTIHIQERVTFLLPECKAAVACE